MELVRQKNVATIINNFSEDIFYAWLAGFWEGEGCIKIYQNSGSKNLECKSCTLDITQNNKEILEAIRNRIRCGNVYKHKDCYDLKIQRRKNIISILEKLIPYLTFRVEQAKDIYSKLLDYENSTSIDRRRTKPWRLEEDSILLANINKCRKELLKLIPSRTMYAIDHRIRKFRDSREGSVTYGAC